MPSTFTLSWEVSDKKQNERQILIGKVGFNDCFQIGYGYGHHADNHYRWVLTCLLPGANPKHTYHKNQQDAKDATSGLFKIWMAGLAGKTPEELRLL